MNYNKVPGKDIKVVGKLLNDYKPIISIITPFYNGGSTLDETANSIFSQTFPFFEWIIVDDGSKDQDSLSKLKELGKKDKRVKIFHKENGGPAQARDYGIEHASESSKYIYFLDCDDIIANTMIEVMYWSLETHPEASFVYPSIINFGDLEYYWEPYFSIEEEIVNNVMCINTMVKKDALLDVGCFGIKEKAMFEDWNLWLKLLSKGYIPIRINAPLFWYRVNSTGEFSRAKKNYDKAMKLINSTAKTIDDDVFAIQFPRIDSKVEPSNVSNMILPKYEVAKSVLFMLPNSVINKNRIFDYELIKRFSNDGYKCFTISTDPVRNNLRQEIEDYSDYYDLSTFIDYGDYVNFINYLIASRNIETIYISQGFINWSLLTMIKSNNPNIKVVNIDHSYFSAGKSKEHKKNNIDSIKKKYNVPLDKRIVSFIERISYDENPVLFVEMAEQLLSKYSDLLFIISGKGPMLDDISDSVEDFSQNVLLLDQVDNDDLYLISDIVVSCPRTEGVSINFYKAITNSIPVVINDSFGQGDVIGNCGIVVSEKDNVDLYIEAVTDILNNYDKYKNDVIKFASDLKDTYDSYYANFKDNKGMNDSDLFSNVFSNFVCVDIKSMISDMSKEYYKEYHGLSFKLHSKKIEKLIKKARTFGIKYYCQNELQYIFNYISRFKKILIGFKELILSIIYFIPVLFKFLKILYKFFANKISFMKRKIFK